MHALTRPASALLALCLAIAAPGCGDGTASGVDAAVPIDSGTDAASPTDSGVAVDTGIDAAIAVDAAPAPGDGGTRSCGGRGGGTCMTNEFCNYAIADICGRADAQGVCAPIPTACATGTEQVCGCDGTTYSSECFANAAGTSVDHRGPCT